MPTNQPSNAPDELGEDARKDLTSSALLADEATGEAPGGGGFGGAAATGRMISGTMRSATIDVPAIEEACDQGDTTEPRPSSL